MSILLKEQITKPRRKPHKTKPETFQQPAANDVAVEQGEAAPQKEETASEDEQTRGEIPEPKPETLPKPTPNRLISLDAFRGLTILGMLLVNNVALDTATPKQMLHAEWSGAVSLADLVFPWFLLIVGVAVPYAAAARRARGEPFWRFLPKVFGRAITLVLLGCLIDSSASHTPVFDLNVLQLIGLAYLVAALLYPLSLPPRAFLAALLLGVHWYVLKHVPQPGAAPGVFAPEQNAVVYLNQAYFQRYHLNGLFSVLPAGAMVLIGTIFGDLFRRESLRPWRKAAAVWILGGILLGAGWLVHLNIPFNKPLWTASFILYTAGWGVLTLGTFYIFLDVLRLRWGALPLLVLGSNPIFAYVAPILTKFYILQDWTWPGPDGKPWPLQTALLHACTARWGTFDGGLAYTLGYVLFWWIVLFILYRKHIFLRV